MIWHKENENLLNNHLYHKDWIDNTSGSAKVVVLLELITILEEKGRHMQSGKIIIGIDCERAYQKRNKRNKKMQRVCVRIWSRDCSN